MIILKYWNAQLQIGIADWKNVYQFPQQQIILKKFTRVNYIIAQGALQKEKGTTR
ncbi:MAG: hypothetical protein ACR2KX_06940 [Chitinophagaceae bacterium]